MYDVKILARYTWISICWGEFDASKYTIFPADKDGILPILDDEYFSDDIVARTKLLSKQCGESNHLLRIEVD